MNETELYEKFRPLIYKYILRRVRDQDKAEDITSAVFVKVIMTMRNPEYDFELTLPYVYTIAKNTLYDSFRKKQPIYSNEIIELAADSIKTDDPYKEREDKEEVLMFLKKIDSPSMRRAIELRYLEGRCYDEIAAILGKNTAAVRQLVHRALETMRGDGRPARNHYQNLPTMKYYYSKQKNAILEVEGDTIYEYLPITAQTRTEAFKAVGAASVPEVTSGFVPFEGKARKPWSPEAREKAAIRARERWAKRNGSLPVETTPI